MKRRRIWAVVAILMLVLLPLLMLNPPEPFHRITRRKEAWQGVLTVWQIDGWYTSRNSMTGALEKAAQMMKKKHPGVVVDVQVKNVAELGHGEAPDIISYPLGAVDDPTGLMVPLTAAYQLVPGLAAVGAYGENIYGVPWCLGGYGLLCNAQLAQTSGIEWQKPGSLPDFITLLQDHFKASGNNKADYTLIAGSAAARQPLTAWAEGLSDPSQLNALLTGEAIAPNTGSLLPQAAFEQFREGDIVYMPAYHGEIWRCYSRYAAGTGFVVSVTPLPGITVPFTDMVQLAGVTGKGEAARQSLSLEYVDILLSDTVQERVGTLGVMPAVMGVELPNDVLTPLWESMISGVEVPNTFDWAKQRDARAAAWGNPT